MGGKTGLPSTDIVVVGVVGERSVGILPPSSHPDPPLTIILAVDVV